MSVERAGELGIVGAGVATGVIEVRRAPTRPRIGVISGYYPGRRFDSHINHLGYCRRHGYTYIDASWPGEHARPHFRKIEVLQLYLHLFDWVFWIDDDAFFTNLEIPLDDFLPDSSQVHFVVCRSPSNLTRFTRFNSGAFLLRNSALSHEFLRAAYEVDLESVRADSWREDLGLFTWGDQTAMVHIVDSQPRFSEPFIRLLSHQSFNSRVADFATSPSEHLVVHFMNDKKREYQTFRRRFGLNAYLLPPDVAGRFKFAQPGRSVLRAGASRIRRWLVSMGMPDPR